MPSAGDRIAGNIRKFRRLRESIQKDVAATAGITRVTWVRWEQDASSASLADLEKVAAALNVRLEDLVAAPRAEPMTDDQEKSAVIGDLVALLPTLEKPELDGLLVQVRTLSEGRAKMRAARAIVGGGQKKKDAG